MADYDLSVTTTSDASTVYAFLRRISDAKAWHTGSSSWVTYVAGDIDHYAVSLTSLGGYLYGAVMPTGVGTGIKMAVQYRERAGAAPALTDLIIGRQTMRWTGSSEEDLGTGVSADAWVTLAAVKAYPGFPASLSDSQVADLINGVTAAIIKWLKRPIRSEARTSWLDGMGSKYLWLDLKPVTEIRRISGSREQASTLFFDGTRAGGYTTAKFRVTSTELKLSSTYMGTVSLTVLTLTDYLTLTELKAAVDAVSMWEMELGGDMDHIPTSELQPTEYVGALSSNTPVYIPGVELADYKVDTGSGMVCRADGERFERGPRNIYVDYTGGYASDDIPDDLKLATYEICLWAAQLIIGDQTLISHRLGDESWTRRIGPMGVSEYHQMFASKLGAYRSPTI